MRTSEWLLLGTCALSLYGMGQVWLVRPWFWGTSRLAETSGCGN